MTDPDRDAYAEDVLFEFASEPSHDRATLERYLREHPTLAAELLDMSLELEVQPEREVASAPIDEAWVAASWDLFIAKTPKAAAIDPFARLTSPETIALRRQLNVPSAVIQGFRLRMVDVTSVPNRFIQEMAESIRTSVEQLKEFLAGPPRLDPQVSYKSDRAPVVETEKISFERLLRESRVDDDRIRDLLYGSE